MTRSRFVLLVAVVAVAFFLMGRFTSIDDTSSGHNPGEQITIAP